MPIIVEEVADTARLEDSSFTRERQTTKSAISFLSRWQQGIRSRIASRSPEYIGEQYPIEFTLPPDPFEGGLLIAEDYLRIYAADVLWGQGTAADWVPLELVDREARSYAHRRPTGWIQGRRLYLVGRAGDWSGVAQARLWWVAKVERLSEPDEILDLPDDETAFDAAVKYLALCWAKRAPKEVHRSVRSFREDVATAEEELLFQALEATAPRKGYTREVR